MKRGQSSLPSSQRSPRACSYRSRRRRPARRTSICPQDTMSFTGTAHDLIVPEGGFCLVTGATITDDLIVLDNAGAEISGTSVGKDVVFHDFAGAGISDTSVAHDVVAAGTDSGADITDSTIGHDFLGQGEESGADILRTTIGHDMRLLGLGGGTHLESVTIGHDFFASTPQTVQTGHNAPDTPGGPVKVGHDFAIDGSPGFPFVFDGLCNLSVGRDLSITNRTVNLGIGARSPLRRERPAGEHDRTRPDRERQLGRVRRSSGPRPSGSATTTSVATSCSATTRPSRAARSRSRGTRWAVTRRARRTTPRSPSARRTARGARTPAADERRGFGRSSRRASLFVTHHPRRSR